MVQKKLQRDSVHNEFDLDGDGVVTDEELLISDAFQKHEKADAQRKMAWVAMWSMLFFTCAVFLPFFSDTRIKALSDLFATIIKSFSLWLVLGFVADIK